MPALGPRVPAETLRRFWQMLAHNQGQMLNGAQLAAGLGVSGHTVARYLDILVDLLLVRRLQPWASNARKRLVRSPKVYVRDSGLVHALLGIRTQEELLGHPVVGPSWEGMLIGEYSHQFAPRSSAMVLPDIRWRGNRPCARIRLQEHLGDRNQTLDQQPRAQQRLLHRLHRPQSRSPNRSLPRKGILPDRSEDRSDVIGSIRRRASNPGTGVATCMPCFLHFTSFALSCHHRVSN